MARRGARTIGAVALCAGLLPACLPLRQNAGPPPARADEPPPASAYGMIAQPPPRPESNAAPKPPPGAAEPARSRPAEAEAAALRIVEPPPPPPAWPPAAGRDDPALVCALRCFLDKHPDAAVESLRRFDPVSRELLLGLLPLTVRLTELGVSRADPREVAVLLEQVQSAAAALRPRAALVLEPLCLCRDMKTFGSYDRYPDGHVFRPGQMVCVYFEVRNFSSAPVAGGYAVDLAATLEVRDRHGALYGQPTPLGKPERRRSPCQDWWGGFRFEVPKAPGAYTVRVQVVDGPTGRTASRQIELRVSNLPG